MSNILVIAGHPDYKSSFANRGILDQLHKTVPSADIVYLDALYPHFRIDVKREQDRLKEAEVIVFDFPFWWFGSPSLLHRYVEEVFAHGFAYGKGGNALHGKKFILSFTAGAPEAAYSANGTEGYPMDAFMPTFLAMAKFTGLDYKGAVISYEMALLEPGNEAMRKSITEKALAHAAKLADMINASIR